MKIYNLFSVLAVLLLVGCLSIPSDHKIIRLHPGKELSISRIEGIEGIRLSRQQALNLTNIINGKSLKFEKLFRFQDNRYADVYVIDDEANSMHFYFTNKGNPINFDVSKAEGHALRSIVYPLIQRIPKENHPRNLTY